MENMQSNASEDRKIEILGISMEKKCDQTRI